MILLDSSKTLQQLVNDNSNGLGKIVPISGEVHEVLNGEYELEFKVSTDNEHFDDIQVGGLLKVKAGETEGWQIFRIYEISKPFNKICTVKGQHISYDLNKCVVRPFTSTGAVNTVNALKSNAINLNGFDITTNITNTTTEFKLEIPRYFRECLGGWDGSFLDSFKCEYEYDNLTVRALTQRGTNSYVRIAYGKNLTDFKQDEKGTNIYTSVIGYAKNGETVTVGNVYDKISSTTKRIKIVDFSKNYDNDNPATVESLTTDARNYANENPIEIPEVNLDIAFVPLYQTEEYKNLAYEPLSMGDTVFVDYTLLGVSASARVVERTWDIVYERYKSIILGNEKPTMNTAIKSIVDTEIKNRG